MQQIDPEDSRSPYMQIAASIRAAILSGELEPGMRLPTGGELAEFYDVARATVASAIRTLKDEGYVRSVPGGAVYVGGEATLPVPAGEDLALAGAAAFLFEAGQLKRLRRSGWVMLGVPGAETVAEHSHRAAIIGIMLATMEGADTGRTSALCNLHDFHETRIGDVDAVGRAYVTTAAPEAISAHQTAGLPDEMGKVFTELTTEFEAAQTPEARCAKDADKLETLTQAVEYRSQGHDTQAWIDNCTTALRTSSAKQLARAITSGDPHWWRAYDSSYHELKASAKKRGRDRRPDDVTSA